MIAVEIPPGLWFCLFILSAPTAAAEKPLPWLVAHRGLLHHAPENTLANFRACLELRLGFEFDVRRTRDGHLVCLHDNTLERTTDGRGKVSDRTLAEIRSLDAGRWFAPQFARQKVPTVAEVLRLVGDYRSQDILIAVDLKAENVEEELVRLAEEHKVLHRLLFIGRTISEAAVRSQLKKASPRAQVAVLANNAAEFPKAVADAEADWVYVRFLPSREQIAAARRSKKKVFIAGATVSGREVDNWQHAVAVGIDAILTDYPLELRALLRQNAPKSAVKD